jgi:hypothetical protein
MSLGDASVIRELGGHPPEDAYQDRRAAADAADDAQEEEGESGESHA